MNKTKKSLDREESPRSVLYKITRLCNLRQRELAARALERDDHACRLCDSRESLGVYFTCPPSGIWSRLQSVTTLCEKCTSRHEIRVLPCSRSGQLQQGPDIR